MTVLEQPSPISAAPDAPAAVAARAEPTHAERAQAAIAELSHAMDCNAPVAPSLLAELKDLLGVG